jgi:uroporphyrinogen decarboxylase
VRTEADVNQLFVPDVSTSLRYVTDAVTLIRKELNGRVPLIGFSGSPWTLACYMVEGSGSDDYRMVKTLMYSRPDLMHRMLQITADTVANYLNAQIEAGAQAVMIFDSWGGVLADGAFQKFSLAYIQQVVSKLKLERTETDANGQTQQVRVPSIVFTKGGGQWLEESAALGCDALGLDWTTSLAHARARVGHRVALQGNLDPMALMAQPAQIQAEVAKVLESFGVPQAGVGHVFNLGHGISQFTPPDNVRVLVDAVHEYSKKQRAK